MAETVGLEGRAGFYDQVGALRDMVQNHMLQLVALVAMEPPAHFNATDVRDEKVKVLRSLRSIDRTTAATHTVTGQYVAGVVRGAMVRGYVDELGTPSSTETFVAVKAHVDNWRWKGVPFYLRTGKRLPNRQSEIFIQFRQVPHSIFESRGALAQPNKLIIRLQPDEGIMLRVAIKEPGPGGMRLTEVPLDMTFARSLGPEAGEMPEAYERLIMDVIRGNQTLFMRGDEVEAAWEWTDPIIRAWEESGSRPLPYDPGSAGPIDAYKLTGADGHLWREIAA